MEIKVTFALLPVAGVLLSLAGFYLPKFQGWYAKLGDEAKQLVMLGGLAIVSLVSVGLSMLGVIEVYPADIKLAWWPALVDFGFAVVANAGTYKSTNKINNNAQERIYHGRRNTRREKLDSSRPRG